MNFTQLQQLWTANGGAPAMAPLMAAIALAESSGTPKAAYTTRTGGDVSGPPYPSDGEGATGLWQIEWPLHQETQQSLTGTTTRSALATPSNNAKMAVALATPPLSAWETDRTWDQWRSAGSPQWPTASEALAYLSQAGIGTGTASATATH